MTNATDAEVTGFAGRPASLADITGETYHGSLSQGVAEDYIVVRIPLANDLRDYRVRQTDTGYEHNWQNLELIDVDAIYRYGGTFVHVVDGSTILAQYSDEQVHTSYRGDIGIDRPTAKRLSTGLVLTQPCHRCRTSWRSATRIPGSASPIPIRMT